MWSTLLRILELLIKTVNRGTTPDQKRQMLAKDLAKIYMDIDEIVSRGRELLSCFGADKLVVTDARIDVLLAQQDALNSLIDHLQRVAPVLEIQLPYQARTLHLLIEGKWEKIMFLLNWFLYDATSPSRVPVLDAYLPPGYLARLLQLDEPLGESQEDGRGLWMQPLDHEGWSEETRPILIATPEDLTDAQNTLNSIAAIAQDLRRFLAERFNVEDVL